VAAFLTDLTDEGVSAQPTEDGFRVVIPAGMAASRLFEIAQACGAQVRHLRPAVPTLEDVFFKAMSR
jgi:hypothetical protein